MTTERLSGLALMNIHHKKPVDYDAVVQKFATPENVAGRSHFLGIMNF